MDTCPLCNPGSVREYDLEILCPEHLQYGGLGRVYRSATVNRKIEEAFSAWRRGDDTGAAALLRFAATHGGPSHRIDIARICRLLATDATDPGGSDAYLAVAASCSR